MSSADSWLAQANLGGQVPVARAIAALRAVAFGTVQVLGADGFSALNRPSLEYMLDLSRSVDQTITADESVRKANAALEIWPSDFLVGLVVQ